MFETIVAIALLLLTFSPVRPLQVSPGLMVAVQVVAVICALAVIVEHLVKFRARRVVGDRDGE